MSFLQWENINIFFQNKPITWRWMFPEMQKTSLNEKNLFWQVGFNGFNIIIIKGQVEGKITTHMIEIKKNLSCNLNLQAWFDASEMFFEKRREGYLPPCSGEKRIIKIMRGYVYDSKKDKIDYPIDVDSKLEGLRFWCSTDFPYTIDGYSSGNIKFRHVDSILKECFVLSGFLPPNCIIDGEIWHPNYNLNEIISIIKSEKKDPRMEDMEYHIFDIWWEEDKCQEIRRSVLELAMKKYRNKIFPCVLNYENNIKYETGGRISELIGKTKLFTTMIKVANNQEEIFKIHRNYVDNMGFEGSILRRRANGTLEDSKEYNLSRYIFGKSRHILKIVDLISEEGICLGVLDSKEKECAKLVLKDIRGNIFTIKPEEPLEIKKKWLKNPKLVVGNYITFTYKQLSLNGKPLNISYKNVRDEPGWKPDDDKVIKFDLIYQLCDE